MSEMPRASIGRPSRSIAVRALTAIGLLTVFASPAAAADPSGDAAHGQRLFLQCRACHTVAPGAPSGVGPNLWGVVGAKAATKAGYGYSAALAGSGIVWTVRNLDSWLTQPTALVSRTKMAFQGVPSAKGREDLIAYLLTLHDPDPGLPNRNAPSGSRR